MINGTPPPPPPASALASASASALAPGSALAPASGLAPASAKPTAKPPASASASALALAPTPTPPALKPAATRIAGKNFTLDVATPGCRVDTPCTMTMRLTAVGDFHVNKEYPYKFLAAATPNVAFLASGDANATTFSRASGDFHEDGEKAATMTVRFKPSATGEAHVTGTYKMSVCSAEACQIETPAVSLDVPVM